MKKLEKSLGEKIDAFSAEKYGATWRKVALFSAEKQLASKFTQSLWRFMAKTFISAGFRLKFFH